MNVNILNKYKKVKKEISKILIILYTLSKKQGKITKEEEIKRYKVEVYRLFDNLISILDENYGRTERDVLQGMTSYEKNFSQLKKNPEYNEIFATLEQIKKTSLSLKPLLDKINSEILINNYLEEIRKDFSNFNSETFKKLLLELRELKPKNIENEIGPLIKELDKNLKKLIEFGENKISHLNQSIHDSEGHSFLIKLTGILITVVSFLTLIIVLDNIFNPEAKFPLILSTFLPVGTIGSLTSVIYGENIKEKIYNYQKFLNKLEEAVS